MQSIKISVTGNAANVTESVPVVSGTVGLPVELVFDDAWDGLQKTAVFRANGRTYDRIHVENSTTVPWELLQSPNCRLYAGVYGTNADGTVQIPTVWADLGVIQSGADPSGDESADPTLPVWQQVQEETVNQFPVKRIDNTGAASPANLADLTPGVYVLTGKFLHDGNDKGKYLFFDESLVTVEAVAYGHTRLTWQTLAGKDRIEFDNGITRGPYYASFELSDHRMDTIDDTADEFHYPTTKAVKDYVDAAAGDMETALDSIIAIQESLIGGAV